jgi:tripartite-type tricarboxylate transporter receptor subunit TctC
MSRYFKTALALAALTAFAAPAPAQEYPTRPIKIIAPFGAGGPGDVFSRQLAQYLSGSSSSRSSSRIARTQLR